MSVFEWLGDIHYLSGKLIMIMSKFRGAWLLANFWSQFSTDFHTIPWDLSFNMHTSYSYSETFAGPRSGQNGTKYQCQQNLWGLLWFWRHTKRSPNNLELHHTLSHVFYSTTLMNLYPYINYWLKRFAWSGISLLITWLQDIELKMKVVCNQQNVCTKAIWYPT